MSVKIRESYTAVVERDRTWTGAFATEPFECAWAGEAIFFVRTLAINRPENITARVQISPDGMHWCDEGTTLRLPAEGATTFCKVTNFGNWLRLVGSTEKPVTVLVTLSLKE